MSPVLTISRRENIVKLRKHFRKYGPFCQGQIACDVRHFFALLVSNIRGCVRRLLALLTVQGSSQLATSLHGVVLRSQLSVVSLMKLLQCSFCCLKEYDGIPGEVLCLPLSARAL